MATSIPPNAAPSIIDVHTPSTSFSIVHALQEESLDGIYDKLSRKSDAATGARGERIGPGWIKYLWNGGVWNLDDDSDYSIFAWRHATTQPPTIHLKNPNVPLPTTGEGNKLFYLYRPVSPALSAGVASSTTRSVSGKSTRSKKSTKKALSINGKSVHHPEDNLPQYKKDFMKFNNENGVRTVVGSIGAVKGVRMLLKNGYRHVYISRNFALRNGFIPADAAPGLYGYGGLVNIGQWPITLGETTTTHSVYLSEETHFDVILGRAFMERRGIKTDPTDLTNVVCLDTGEKLVIEVVVLKDGRGEIVTVT
ncbi:hypothetical protein SISNIDRAFT_470213 [Sistotremastrum niveocremeum HHB9708]|uniref:Uncharacterized protein n=1 Tax=Sistotremastrum niveocremeum HHB9708 TaxID=1314777 RepID=A0A164P6M5_9AGAM|nr:hypothetical protein SISNIDRAFT_470213 [Sistotremastrum niveocremeum HHB9708]